MKKQERDNYIFAKKSLLLQLFLFYYSDVPYDALVLRSFGFSFDPTCNFKAIVKSHKGHIHKYVTHIFLSMSGVNFEKMDVMGDVNIIRVKNITSVDEFYEPEASLNVYFDGAKFYANGYLEGKKIDYRFSPKKKSVTDDLLFHLGNDKKLSGINSSADCFVLWLMKLYTSKLNVDLIMGAGINADYGAKDWSSLIDCLNNDFYQGDYKFADEIEHYVGKELFTSSMVLKTSGFDSYKSLNRELYEFPAAKSFDDPDSTLYHCVDYIEKHAHTTVITYNYDTNLEYLLKKRGIRYTTVYDDNSFVDKEAGVDIYHVHGLLPYDKYNEKKFTDSLIFNESEYYYLYNNPYSWNIAKQLHDFKFNVCIFIGISLTDPDMKRLLELAQNYLKFNFIFLKKEKDFSETVYRDLTSYFFTFDLIVIWIDEYSQIADYLENL
ncbi:MAG: SIR2 family protein [Candidatus Enterosoma sp.]|nr:SIR2 family protein [Bacilli bacterium]MDD7181415.1 SIR2 family protein [Bacilli bacterium]MDY3046708.1 SIR2 family protein [Candidatus Enterosoma sp.]